MKTPAKIPLYKPPALRALDQAGIVYRPLYDGKHVLTDCPDCGKPMHFYVNVMERVGFCQRCRQGFTWDRIAKLMRLPRLGPDPAPTLEGLRTMVAHFGTPKVDARMPKIALPMGCLPAEQFPEALAYLEKRGLKLRRIMRNGIRFCPYGPYAMRVLLPVTFKRRTVGFAARSIRKEQPPWLFPRGFPAGRLLYPETNLERELVLFVENSINALRFTTARVGGLCVFGKHISERQLVYLRKHIPTVKHAVLALDRDAWFNRHGEHGLPPAHRAWRLLKDWFPVVGLVLPPSAAQPDDLPGRAIVDVAELAVLKSKGEPAIWDVSRRGRLLERSA